MRQGFGKLSYYIQTYIVTCIQTDRHTDRRHQEITMPLCGGN